MVNMTNTQTWVLSPAEVAAINAMCSPSTATVPFVDTDMAKRLRRTGLAVTKAVADRNAAILEAHAAGCSLRDIASEVGITHVAVHKIIRKGGES